MSGDQKSALGSSFGKSAQVPLKAILKLKEVPDEEGMKTNMKSAWVIAVKVTTYFLFINDPPAMT